MPFPESPFCPDTSESPDEDVNVFLREQHLDRISGSLFSRSAITPLFPKDRNESYPIASVTKTFTAWCCLLPDARPYLDRPIVEVLPEFRLKKDEVTRKLTPRDALCHHSGLLPQTASWIRSTQSRRDYLKEYLPTFEVAADYNSVHRYSNVMYAVLGLWLEAIFHQPWEVLIDTYVREAFGLKDLHHIAPGWEQYCPPPTAYQKGIIEKIPPFFSSSQHPIAPASELRSTMKGLARWGQIHLDLHPEDERWQPHSRVSTQREQDELGPLHYGLGWRLDTVSGIRRVWHSGQCSGYTTLLSLYPDVGIGSAFATNQSSATQALHSLDLQFLHRNQTL